MKMPKALRAFWLSVTLFCIACIWQLESERRSVFVDTLDTAHGAVTLYKKASDASGPVVLVTHGFAGSRQMMQYISRSLARSGYVVAAFDFYGHGRNPALMSPDVTRIEGTTKQLVIQTKGVVDALRESVDISSGIALLGHSMATDIVIRAAQDIPETRSIVAISMYSDAITAEFPERLLILSGEWEGRLRKVGKQAVALVSGQAVEGITVQAGTVVRRAVAVPNTEHVAVLFSTVTMAETESWLNQAFDRGQGSQQRLMGGWIIGLLVSLVALSWPFCRWIPTSTFACTTLKLKPFLMISILPAFPAIGAAMLAPPALWGIAGFGSLLAFFGVWGAVALGILLYFGAAVTPPRLGPMILLLIWALGVFGLALDRYGAAFVPTGPRINMMAIMCVGTVPFMLADRLLVAGQVWWLCLLARCVPILALSGAMVLSTQGLGLLFTVLPVMVLFYFAFGVMGRALDKRAGPVTAGIGLGVILAWSVTASTPLFAG